MVQRRRDKGEPFVSQCRHNHPYFAHIVRFACCEFWIPSFFYTVITVLNTLLAVAFALSSALVIAWGTVVRHKIALEAENSVMRTAMKRPLWWVGTFAAVVAYGLQIIALGFGTLLIVQPILVLSLMFTLPMAAWYANRKMVSNEILWSALLTAAVAILIVLGRPEAGISRPPLDRWLPALAVGLAAMLALAFLSTRIKSKRALLLGIVCGTLYGYVAVLSKAVVDIFRDEGTLPLLASWEFYALVGSAGIGTVLQQYSFHSGPLTQSLPAMTIMEPIVAFSLGYIVLNEKFRVDSILGWTTMAIALLVMIYGTVQLSQRPLQSPREHRKHVSAEPRTKKNPARN